MKVAKGSGKWRLLDLQKMVLGLSVTVLVLFAPFTFNWEAFWVFVALSVITGMLGITLSYHRNLTHRSFSLPKWLEYSFAYCGVQAIQWDPIEWVSKHRFHHQNTDTDQDPHSPLEGFWFSHMGWLFDQTYVEQKIGNETNVEDLVSQTYYRFLQQTYFVHPILLGLLLYKIGGFPYVVWGMGVRVAWVYQISFLGNSVCHMWGRRVWNTGDLSTNNWWVAILTHGEGWHNNHHAFEYSARHGIEWWEVDTTWYLIRLLEALGLADNVKLPLKSEMQKLAPEKGGAPKLD